MVSALSDLALALSYGSLPVPGLRAQIFVATPLLHYVQKCNISKLLVLVTQALHLTFLNNVIVTINVQEFRQLSAIYAGYFFLIWMQN